MYRRRRVWKRIWCARIGNGTAGACRPRARFAVGGPPPRRCYWLPARFGPACASRRLRWLPPTPAPRRRRRARKKRAAFIPLPNAAGSPQDDDVDLVRVELPRSAVTALGMPASDDGDAESVEAEVLVGPDGMARAVRFLN
jgi:hypothetical protein